MAVPRLGGPKCRKMIIADEICWLRKDIYRYDASPTTKRLSAFDRFKG